MPVRPELTRVSSATGRQSVKDDSFVVLSVEY